MMKSLIIQICEDLKQHGSDWTRSGFRSLAVYRFGQWRNTIRYKLVRAPLSILYRFLFRFCRNIYCIELPETARIGKNVVLEHVGYIVVHPQSVIGDGCILRQGVTLGNRNYGIQKAPVLGKNVDIGVGAKILGGITIGDNVTIGANSVVLNNIPSNSVVAGIPAKIIKTKVHILQEADIHE